MESANLTTRTYTAQTCSLSVTIKPRSLPHLPRFDRPKSGDFTLQIDRAEDPGAEPIRLNGQLDQLAKLQQSVSQYVAQLVAKFPMGTPDDGENHPPEIEDLAPAIPEAVVVDRLYPTSGIVKNLPGLRHKSSQLTVQHIPAQEPKTSNAFSAASISKLLGRSNPVSTSLVATETPVPSKAAPNGGNDLTGTLPRLTAGDRPLEHKLYLSDNNSGRVLALSQSQLFDLGTTLDEYTNEVVTTPSVAPQKIDSVKTSKIEALKVEAPKVEAPKVEALKVETPKVEALKVEAPKVEAPKVEALKVETPKVEALKIEAPEVETPKVEALKIEAPEVEAPKVERSEKFSSVATTSALSRLPNLPNLPGGKTASNRSYDYGDESQPAFMSALPWVAAAAIVVGVPLLLFGSNPDLLKESMAKVKMPSDPRELFNNKKVAGSNKPEQPAIPPTGDGVANAATAGMPKPWEAKPVEPPASKTTAALPGTPIPQPPGGANVIGIAPLPPSIMNITEERAEAQNLPLTPTPAAPSAAAPSVPKTTPGAPGAAVASVPPQINPLPSGIAPNPLSSAIPTGNPMPVTKKQAPIPGAKPSTQPNLNKPIVSLGAMPKIYQPNTNNPAASFPSPVRSTASAPKANQVKKVATRNTSKIGVSQQPVNLPPAFEAIDNEPPLTPPPFPAVKAYKPTPVKQQKKVVVKSKPKPVAVTKKVAKVVPLKNRQPKQPVIIVPVQPADPSTVPSEFATPPGMPQTNLPEVPPIVTQPQLQSNNGDNNPFENSSLQETKRYFQDKWRADSTQTSTLQYVVQVNGKNGVVQSVNPQGEAATTYLKKTGVIKAGQKLVAPITTGESDQKIRVLLHPDGNVDALPEP
jgi:Domain of unknown function (DUF4335)